MKSVKTLSIILAIGMSGLSIAANYSDGEITAIIKATDKAAIEAAEEAQKKATDSRVRDFAKRIVKSHKEDRNAVANLAKKEKIEEDLSSKEVGVWLRDKTNRTELAIKDGQSFDRAYIENEIRSHRSLLDDLNQRFIPNATNPQLKAHLEKTRSKVEKHLEEARAIDNSLPTTGG